MLVSRSAIALERVGQQADLFLGGALDFVSRRIAEEGTDLLHPARADMGGTATQRMGKIADVAQIVGCCGTAQMAHRCFRFEQERLDDFLQERSSWIDRDRKSVV